MLSLGSAQEVIEGQIKAGNVKFDLGMFLENVVMADIASPGKKRFLDSLYGDIYHLCPLFSVSLPVRSLSLDREQVSRPS
jgi:hypothetical protein